MTHEEARELLPRYAAGILSDESSDAVRAHLVRGCRDCLEDLFRRPFGLTAPDPDPDPPAPEPPPVLAPRPVGRRRGGLAVGAAVALVVAAASLMLARGPRPETAPIAPEGELGPTVAELKEQRAGLAVRLAGLEAAAATAASASREAEETRAAMAEKERELESERLRVGALKRDMRRQDVDFEQKRRSMEAMIARLSGPVAGGAAGPARQQQTLFPCETSHLDLWRFAARRGRRYTITAETVDAASAADLCLVGSCDGGSVFSADDEIPCRSAPDFGCPRATVDASADGACVVAVTVCSRGCGAGRAARYEISVDGAESLALVDDDASAISGETADVF